MFLGPALSLFAVATDAYSMHQEKQREQKMADIRHDITSQFQSIAKDLENQIHLQLWEFEQQVYGEIDKQIAAARQHEESAIAASNIWVKQLAEIRKDFDLILRYISKATENP
ncbi:GTP-binding protein HSR1-related protein [Tolypothrix sp. NIES-4075]|nr:GTP-binding protein HSR1-related protein [Tolypothrix sp. NIES-4075]